jgi:hypothetical protein
MVDDFDGQFAGFRAAERALGSHGAEKLMAERSKQFRAHLSATNVSAKSKQSSVHFSAIHFSAKLSRMIACARRQGLRIIAYYPLAGPATETVTPYTGGCRS